MNRNKKLKAFLPLIAFVVVMFRRAFTLGDSAEGLAAKLENVDKKIVKFMEGQEETRAEIDKDLARLRKHIGEIEEAEGDEDKSLSTRLKQVESSLEQSKQAATEIQAVLDTVGKMDKDERSVFREIGLEIVGTTRGGSGKQAEAWKLFERTAQEKTLAVIEKSPDADSNADGYVMRPTFQNQIGSVQVGYGVIRDNIPQTPMGRQLIWLEEVEDVHPDVTVNVQEGCCVDACPETEDVENWTVRSISPTTFGRYVCIPLELIEDAFIDVVGFYATTKLARKFAFIEDFYGFAWILQNPNSPTHDVGAAFSNLDWDDVIQVPFTNEIVGMDHGLWINKMNLAGLMTQKGTDGHYMAPALSFATGGRFGGERSVFDIFRPANILPGPTMTGADKPFAFYGELAEALKWGVARDMTVRTSEHFKFNCNVLTVGATARYAFGVPGEQSSKTGVILKTT